MLLVAGQYAAVSPDYLKEAARWSPSPGAAYRIRTCDPLITNQVLYQLSYASPHSNLLSVSPTV